MFVTFKQIRPNRWGEAPDEIVETRVRADSVRCFTARRDGRTGSRLTFAGGGGFPVLESPPVVMARLQGLPEPEWQEPQPQPQQQPQPEEEEEEEEEEDSGEITTVVLMLVMRPTPLQESGISLAPRPLFRL